MVKIIALILSLFLASPCFGGGVVRGSGGEAVGDSMSFVDSNSNSGTGTSGSVTAPSGSNGDLLVATITNDNGNDITATGWTLINDPNTYFNDYTSADTAMYYRVATGSDTFSTSWSTSTEWCAAVLRFEKTGSKNWNIDDYYTTLAYGLDSGNTDHDITATLPGMLVVLWGSDDPATISTNPTASGYTSDEQVTPASTRAGAWHKAVVSAGTNNAPDMILGGGQFATVFFSIGLTE